MSGPRELDCDDLARSFLGAPPPAGTVVRPVSIPAHGELAYEPSQWTGALVIVEAGEIEVPSCSSRDCRCVRSGTRGASPFCSLPSAGAVGIHERTTPRPSHLMPHRTIQF
jgi:hypothetical protein